MLLLATAFFYSANFSEERISEHRMSY